MTRRLRSRHRWIWLALTALLPAILIAALFARRPEPLNGKLPAATWITEKHK